MGACRDQDAPLLARCGRPPKGGIGSDIQVSKPSEANWRETEAARAAVKCVLAKPSS